MSESSERDQIKAQDRPDIWQVLREMEEAVEEWPGPEGRKEKPRKALAAIAGIVRGETSSGA